MTHDMIKDMAHEEIPFTYIEGVIHARPRTKNTIHEGHGHHHEWTRANVSHETTVVEKILLDRAVSISYSRMICSEGRVYKFEPRDRDTNSASSTPHPRVSNTKGLKNNGKGTSNGRYPHALALEHLL